MGFKFFSLVIVFLIGAAKNTPAVFPGMFRALKPDIPRIILTFTTDRVFARSVF
jgi:hypothetical protein